jgi:hypothetical protein
MLLEVCLCCTLVFPFLCNVSDVNLYVPESVCVVLVYTFCGRLCVLNCKG